VALELAADLVQRLGSLSPSSRLCVGISGAAGAGKTTLSAQIVYHVNAMCIASKADEMGIVVPLDGWHLPRSILDKFPDPKLAHDRRGAHWTFDGEGYVSFVQQLCKPIPEGGDGEVTAPSFSHSLKDPVFNDVVVRPRHRIVLIEGLYVFLGIDPWVKAARLLDERWFVHAEADQGRQRLCKRHVETGVASSWEEALWRADNNDIPNGAFVEANMLTPTRRILSVEDPTLPRSV